MPKAKTSASLKLSNLANEFKNESVVLESGNLFCTACGKILGMSKFLIQQHIASKKHTTNCTLKSKHQPIPGCLVKNEFLIDLCEVSKVPTFYFNFKTSEMISI